MVRVAVFTAVTAASCELVGYGTHMGFFRHPDSGQISPKIELDSGLEVWGIYFSWMEINEFKVWSRGLEIRVQQ